MSRTRQAQRKEMSILSLRVAQQLLLEGYQIIRIEHSYRHRGKLAFVFEYSEQLDRELAKFERRD